MFVSKLQIAFVAAAVLSLTPGLGAGVAKAQVEVVVPTPRIFVPAPEFEFHEGGYYRTHDGNYYHYDQDRSGWHYGRNHREGVRWEARHHGR